MVFNIASCKNPIILIDFLQEALEYFYFLVSKGIKNTPHLYRLVLAVIIVFLQEPRQYKYFIIYDNNYRLHFNINKHDTKEQKK